MSGKSPLERLRDRKGLLHRLKPEQVSRLLGDALDVFCASPDHRSMTIATLMGWILPPIHFDQFRIYRDGRGQPVGWVSWAWMNEAESEAFTSGPFEFDIPVWTGGDKLWIVDLVAPHGHGRKIVNDLRTNVFPGDVAHMAGGDEGEEAVRRLIGADVKSGEWRDAAAIDLKPV